VRLDILDGRYAGEKAKSVDDLRQESRWRDGMKGPSERVMFDLLPMIATADPEENGLDPVLALKELRKLVVRERLPDYGEPDKDAKKCSPEVIVNDVAFKRCLRIVSRAIQEAYYEDWPAYVAAKFEEYVDLIIAWAENEDFKDQHGTIVKHAEIVEKLYKFENGMALHELERHLFSGGKPPERKLGTDDVAAYRKRVGLAALRHRSTPANAGKLVWHSLPEHLCSAFEANVRLSKAEMRDRIELKERTDPEKRKEHDAFFARMCARGYTRFQAERVVTWYLEHGA
jgi:predicted Ser/Thr protein kinase